MINVYYWLVKNIYNLQALLLNTNMYVRLYYGASKKKLNCCRYWCSLQKTFACARDCDRYHSNNVYSIATQIMIILHFQHCLFGIHNSLFWWHNWFCRSWYSIRKLMVIWKCKLQAPSYNQFTLIHLEGGHWWWGPKLYAISLSLKM